MVVKSSPCLLNPSQADILKNTPGDVRTRATARVPTPPNSTPALTMNAEVKEVS